MFFLSEKWLILARASSHQIFIATVSLTIIVPSPLTHEMEFRYVKDAHTLDVV